MSIIDKMIFWKNEKKEDTKKKEKKDKKPKKEKVVQEVKSVKYKKKQQVPVRENKKEDFENKLEKKEEVKIDVVEAKDRVPKKEKKVKNKVYHEKKLIQKEDFDLFGVKAVDVIVNNKYKGEVIDKTNTSIRVFIEGAFNEIIILNNDLENAYRIGDSLEFIVTHRKNGEFYGSEKKVAQFNKVEELQDFVKLATDFVGVVESFENNVFNVKLNQGYQARVYIKDMDCRYITEPEKYLGKEFTFELKNELKEGQRRIELTRRDIAQREIDEAFNKINENDILVVETPEVVKGGIRFTSGLIEGFIPNSEVSYERFEDLTDKIEDFINKEAKVIEKKTNKRGNLTIVASFKALQEDPFEVFKREVEIDSEQKAVILDIRKYGFILMVDGKIRTLLHQNDMSNEMSATIKEYKVGDEITVKIKGFDDDKLQVKTN